MQPELARLPVKSGLPQHSTSDRKPALGRCGRSRVDMIKIEMRSPLRVDPAPNLAGITAIGSGQRDYLWRLHDAHQAAIRFADTKAGAAVGMTLAVTGATLSTLVQAGRAGGAGLVLRMAVFALAASFFATLTSALMTLLPRRGARTDRMSVAGHPYFGIATRVTQDDYCRAVALLDDDGLGLALARDSWRLARLADRKFVWVARTLWGTAANVVAASAVLITLWLIHH